MSMNSAGSVALAFARWIEMVPDSSGWRNASSTDGANSVASSKNSTPFEAREMMPGAIVRVPPPTIALSVVE